MIIGQVPHADPGTLGQWIVAGAAVLAIAYLIKNLFFEKRQPGYEHVTKSELNEIRESLKQCVTKSEFINLEIMVRTSATKEEVKDVKFIIEKMDGYMHSLNHEMRGSMQNLIIRQERILVMIDARVSHRTEGEQQKDPVNS